MSEPPLICPLSCNRPYASHYIYIIVYINIYMYNHIFNIAQHTMTLATYYYYDCQYIDQLFY